MCLVKKAVAASLLSEQAWQPRIERRKLFNRHVFDRHYQEFLTDCYFR
jgi:hypothetical protein